MATDRSRPMKTGLLPPSSTAVAPAPSREVIIQGDGPAPALAHGAGAGVFGHYGLALDDLARDRAVIGPHHPGAGGTPEADRPLQLGCLTGQSVSAATTAGHDTFPVVGESLGCAVAVRAAPRHPAGSRHSRSPPDSPPPIPCCD
ncbi:alpha/beta hydrolase [Streptomyces sp. NPDC045470]|uniref:alpha/beta fold hydrolase n=1 Tax=Streptomyces sp. NPDC045470 TaxID=3155469 RepID=UPI0033C69D40